MPRVTKNVLIHKGNPGSRRAREQQAGREREEGRHRNEKAQVDSFREFVRSEKQKGRNFTPDKDVA